MKSGMLLLLSVVFLAPPKGRAEEIVRGISENPDRPARIDEDTEKDVRDLLTNTVFPTLEIHGMSFRDALRLIQFDAARTYSGKVEPNRRGLSFIVEGGLPSVKISFSGKNVSYGLALDEICRQGGMLWTNRGKIFLSPGNRFTKRKSPFPGEILLP